MLLRNECSPLTGEAALEAGCELCGETCREAEVDAEGDWWRDFELDLFLFDGD